MESNNTTAQADQQFLDNPCEKVRNTCNRVLEISTQNLVQIDSSKISNLLETIKQTISATNGPGYDKWSDFHLENPTQYTPEQITTYVFVVDAMNFCFWPNNPSGQFEYENMTRNLEAILKNDPSFFTCDRLVNVDEAFMRENVFTPDGFCLVNERARIVREMAAVIKSKY